VQTPRRMRSPVRAFGLRRLAFPVCLFLLGVVAGAAAAQQQPTDPAKLLERLRAERLRRQRQQEQRFQALLGEGKRLLEKRDYQRAQRLLAQAAAIHPDDRTCKSLLAQARARSVATSPDEALRRIKEERQFKNETLLVQLRMSIFEAEKALKAADHARASEHARRVLVGASALGDAAEASRLRTQAQRLLAQADALKGKAVSSQLSQAAASARERALGDKDATLRTLARQGWRLEDSGEHQKALDVAEEMLRLDPGNRRALELRRVARQGLQEQGSLEALRQERKKAENEHLGRLIDEEMRLTPQERAKIVLPARRERRREEAAQSPKPTWERRLREKLQSPLEANIASMTLAEACRYLSGLSACPIIVDPAVAKEARRYSLPPGMRLSLEHYLKWLCRFAGAVYTLRDHAIFVTRTGGLLDEPVQKDYEISELIVPTRTVRATFTGASQVEKRDSRRELLAAVQKPRDFVVEDTPPDEALGKSWVEFIRGTVAPETWERSGGKALQERPRYSIQYRNGRIVVVHTPEVHKQIEELLDSFRKARNLQVHIRTRFLLLDMDFLKAIDTDFGVDAVGLAAPAALGSYGYTNNPLDPFLQAVPPGQSDWSVVGSLINDAQVGDLPGGVTRSGAFNFTYAYLDDDQVNAVLQAVLKRRKGSVLITPWLTCFNTQRANFQAVTNFNYVRRLNADGEPEIGNVPEGIIFDVQPFVSADRRYITLVLQPQMRTLINRDFQTQAAGFQYAAGLTRVVNLPETELRSLATTVTVPDGGTLFVGGLAQARESAGEGSLPFLRGIPLLRYLFREWAEVERRESLLVMVTARILPDIFEEGE